MHVACTSLLLGIARETSREQAIHGVWKVDLWTLEAWICVSISPVIVKTWWRRLLEQCNAITVFSFCRSKFFGIWYHTTYLSCCFRSSINRSNLPSKYSKPATWSTWSFWNYITILWFSMNCQLFHFLLRSFAWNLKCHFLTAQMLGIYHHWKPTAHWGSPLVQVVVILEIWRQKNLADY